MCPQIHDRGSDAPNRLRSYPIIAINYRGLDVSGLFGIHPANQAHSISEDSYPPVRECGVSVDQGMNNEFLSGYGCTMYVQGHRSPVTSH